MAAPDLSISHLWNTRMMQRYEFPCLAEGGRSRGARQRISRVVQETVLQNIDQSIVRDRVALRTAIGVLNDIYGLSLENLSRGFNQTNGLKFLGRFPFQRLGFDGDQRKVEHVIRVVEILGFNLEERPDLHSPIHPLVIEISTQPYG